MKAEKPLVDQRHEYVERKRKHYHIVIFPEILGQERRGEMNTMVIEHFNSNLYTTVILLISSIPNNQLINQIL